MSDQSRYVNTYIENSMGMIHEYVSLVLQLKTQVKIANDVIVERDAVISSLQSEMESIKLQSLSSSEEIDRFRTDASRWEREYNVAKSKIEHIDTFANQINEMKQMLIEKNREIEKLQKKIESLTKSKLTKSFAPKKLINTEDKSEQSIAMKDPDPVDKNDDF